MRQYDLKTRRSIYERILSKIKKDIKTGCWIWQGALSGGDGRKKYGYIRIDGKSLRVHRVVYGLFNNKNIDGLLICHHCDNSACVNPEHLFIGKTQDNMDDMIKKGRHKHPNGEKNNSKLTTKQVLKIRQLSLEGWKNPSIARAYNVAVTTIRNIVIRKKWKHI